MNSKIKRTIRLAILLTISMALFINHTTSHAAEWPNTNEGLEESRGNTTMPNTPADGFEEFVVGATTKLSGNFFTNMWGNNTCDIDVRMMLHGYETVHWSTQSSFEINPTVVREWSKETLANKNRRYTITVWDDLTYNNGTAIDGRDYVFSFLLSSAPQIEKIGGIITNNLHIKGWAEYSGGQSPYFAGIRLLGKYTFSVEIQAEYLPFFFEAGMIEAIPYPISEIAPGCEVTDNGHGAFVRNIDQRLPEIFTAETLSRTILDPETGYLSHPRVTSGPWQLESFDWETRVLKAKINPRFKGNWEGRKPAIDYIVFKSVLPGTMVSELERGEVHLLNKVVAGADITEGIKLLSAGKTDMASYTRLGFGFINFACEEGPTMWQAVRQAVAYGIDIQGFVKEYTQGYGMQVYGYYGIGQWMVRILNGIREDSEIMPEDIPAWEKLTMDGLNPYLADIQKAKYLLIEDGWTLNEAGKPFVDGKDTVRAKMIDGQLKPLRLKYGKTEGSTGAEMLRTRLEGLSEIGFAIETTEVPFVEVLEHYYRQTERTYDMLYLGTNFISIFDPFFVFNTRDEYQGHQNTSGYRDAELVELALELRKTPPGAYLEYTRKWLKFQHAFNEKLPMLPLYSDFYFDFFTNKLQEYHPDSEHSTWPAALLYATLAKPSE